MSAIASTSTFDIEAQRPAPAVTRSILPALNFRARDPLDSSFGYTFSTESRHDEGERRQSVADVLPPYTEDADIPLPGYTREAPEPATLAMFLFKFGFLFPPFWFFGAFILLSPLREPVASTPTEGEEQPATWMPEKTPDERAALLAKLREVEVKWAKRCLAALLVIVLLAVSAGLASWFIIHH